MTVFAPPIPRDDATERDTQIANPRFARAPSGRTVRFASRGAPSSSSSRSRQTPRPPPRPKLPPPGADPALAEKENANVIRAAKAYGDHHAGAEARARVLDCAFDGNRPRTPPRANEPERARGTTHPRSRSAREPPMATRPTSDGASRSRSRDTGVDASTSPSGTVSPVSSSDGSPRALDASAPAWAPGSAALDVWEKPRRRTRGARPSGTRRAWSADASPYAASLTGTLPHIRTRGVGDASGWAFGSKRAKERRRWSVSSRSSRSRTRDVVDAAESRSAGDSAASSSGTTLGYKEEAELWESRAAVLTQEREALREECAAKDGELLVLRERLEALESAARVASPAGSSAGSSESPPPRAETIPGGEIGFALSPEFSPPAVCAFGPPTVDDSPPRWMSGARAGHRAGHPRHPQEVGGVGGVGASFRDPLKMTFSRYTVGGNITDDETSDEEDAKAEDSGLREASAAETASEEAEEAETKADVEAETRGDASVETAETAPMGEPAPAPVSLPARASPESPALEPPPSSSPPSSSSADLAGALAERDRLAADVTALEEALAASRDDRSDLAARLAFARLDVDRDGLIGIDELLRAEAFASYGQAVVERVHAVWDYGRGNGAVSGMFTEEDWRRLCRFQERRADADAARFWFRVADVDGDGMIGAHDVRWMYDAVWKDEATCVTLRDFTAQIFDMAGGETRLARGRGASLRDIRNSKLAAGIFGLLCNHNDMLLRRSTAEFSDSDVPM